MDITMVFMEVASLLGLFLLVLMATMIFFGLRRFENIGIKVWAMLIGIALLLESTLMGWAIIQPGWFLERGSLSNQIVNWCLLSLGIIGFLTTLGLVKLKKLDKLVEILAIVGTIILVVLALFRIAQS